MIGMKIHHYDENSFSDQKHCKENVPLRRKFIIVMQEHKLMNSLNVMKIDHCHVIHHCDEIHPLMKVILVMRIQHFPENSTP